MSASWDWVSLFRSEAPRLVRFLSRFGPAVSPEDVAQESFARLYAAEPENVASPRAFLFQTARNLAIDQVRRGRASPVRAVADLSGPASADPLPSPEEARIFEEEREVLEGAIASLPEGERAALLLRRVEGLAPAMIAQRLGVSERQVRRLIAHALARCQAQVRALRDNEPGPG